MLTTNISVACHINPLSTFVLNTFVQQIFLYSCKLSNHKIQTYSHRFPLLHQLTCGSCAVVKIHDYKISRFSFSDFYLAVSTALAILTENKTSHYQPVLLCAYFAACCIMNAQSPSVIGVMTCT